MPTATHASTASATTSGDGDAAPRAAAAAHGGCACACCARRRARRARAGRSGRRSRAAASGGRHDPELAQAVVHASAAGRSRRGRRAAGRAPTSAPRSSRRSASSVTYASVESRSSAATSARGRRSSGTCTVTSASVRGLRIVELRSVSDDELLVRDHELVVVGRPHPRVREPDLLDDAAARPRSRPRRRAARGCVNAISSPAMKLPIVRCAAKPMHEAEHGGRGEDRRRRPRAPAGSRAAPRGRRRRRSWRRSSGAGSGSASPPSGVRSRRLIRRSTSFATTRRDADHDERRRGTRCPEAASLIVAHSQSIALPAGETLLEAVPPLDRVLADAPAEQHVLALAHGREVEQPRLGVLHLDAERRRAASRQSSSSAASRENSGVRASPTAVAAAVAGDDLHDLALLALELGEPGPQRDHPLGKRAHPFQGAVSLGRSERAGGHGARTPS